ncbi:DUF58 domain-containing protein [Deinococcus ruber]|uniref:DUF58 domain-containing protein n=1 Tax=Deinococcus ruber TaxID=1848197 RepID=A0A918BXE6_9DEIO|nr:DUF58 domain-containing protein [Deinococcus ruber]GGQ94879.1 hypothetical protein GCM10008957_03910 [Deinococcus ruber]
MTQTQASPQAAPARAPRIYVLPTRFGGAFVLFALLTLIGCINYLLSLGYALTFLLLGVWVVGAVSASRVLTGLHLELTPPERAFAGGEALMEAAVHVPEGQQRTPVGVKVGGVLTWLPAEVPQTGVLRVPIRLPTPQRGEVPLPTVRFEGHDPLGLWHSTSYPENTSSGSPPPEDADAGQAGATLPPFLLVFPAPEVGAPPPPLATQRESNPDSQRRAGDEEAYGLREYRPGDAPRRMAWKQTARLGTPLTRLYDAPAASMLTLDWDDTRALEHTEARLSRLTAWVLEAERRNAAFVLRLPGVVLDVPASSGQVRRALELLAKYDLPAPPPPRSRRFGPLGRRSA